MPSLLLPLNFAIAFAFHSTLPLNIALADSLATLALFLPFLFLPDLAKSSGIEADKV